MMLDVAKSMVGFSYAVSLFSLQQLDKQLGGLKAYYSTGEQDEAANARDLAIAAEFDDVSRAVQLHLSEPMAERFRTADEWQRRVLDETFRVTVGYALGTWVITAGAVGAVIRQSKS